jgi:radical SAM protein with 4Fe4S-binding SPASM domain
MNIAQLETVLNQQYSVKAMIDLAELSRSPGAVYKFFYGLHQDAFEPNDRIVIYTSHHIPDTLLKHLYDAASFIDISSWFILICTPTCIPNTEEDSFRQLLISLEPTVALENNYILPDTICAIPWTHLEVRGSGQMYPCCVMKNSTTIGNVQTTTLKDAFNGEFMQSLRTDLLDGKKPVACQACWDIEDRGMSSNRTHNIKRLKKQFLLEYLEKPAINSVDIKFNNTCNFKCRICNPDSSSLIAAENHKFLGIPINVQSKWSDSDKFIQETIELLPHLSNIDMYGGEPFLIEKFSNVLHMAVEQGYAKNIRLHYNSNGSIWPEKFIPLWKHFKEVDIHFSVDAIGKRFDLERGSTWQHVEANILRLKDLNFDNINICLTSTVSIMNVYYIDEVYDWALTHGFKLFSNILLTPFDFNIKNLTQEAQDLIIKKFANHPWPEIQRVLRAIESTPASDGVLFREKIKWFDSVRQENFADSHPEIAKAMGYVYNSNV